MKLARLRRDLETLYKKGVLPFLNYRVQHGTVQELDVNHKEHRAERRRAKAGILDHQN